MLRNSTSFFSMAVSGLQRKSLRLLAPLMTITDAAVHNFLPKYPVMALEEHGG